MGLTIIYDATALTNDYVTDAIMNFKKRYSSCAEMGKDIGLLSPLVQLTRFFGYYLKHLRVFFTTIALLLTACSLRG